MDIKCQKEKVSIINKGGSFNWIKIEHFTN
jgi:hypothetical protein